MLKILNTDQIKAWDAYTILHEPVASIDLMERACKAFVQWFTAKFVASNKVGIVCGGGNNGGDGLGIARLLSEWGYPVKVWIVKGSVVESMDFKINKNRLPKQVTIHTIETTPELQFQGCDILIDGLFGSGLSRPVEGIYEEVINQINNEEVVRVSIDIPSGLMADRHSIGACVKADYTVTFQSPKLAFLLPENEDRVGQWSVVDIGLKKSYLKEAVSSYFLVEKKDVARSFPERKKFANKGDFGKALLVAGSYGKMGACILAARAAMRSGVGLLTAHVPANGYEIIQLAAPEVMASIDKNDSWFSGVENVDEFNAIGIGPGLGMNEATVKGFQLLLEKSSGAMVIDADALNILSEHRELLHLIPKQSILTPHPGEFKRLVGGWSDDFDKLEKAKELSVNLGSVIVLKGAHTAIVSPDRAIYFNCTGNPGMATGGSGDVLTGVLTALLAQGLPSLNTAIIGVFVHGLAGDIAAFEKGFTSIIASDIISALPEAFKQVIR